MARVTAKDVELSIAHADEVILNVQLVDYEIPGMTAGDYTFEAVQTLSVDGDKTFTQAQSFRVRAPRFTVDESTIQATYPPPSSRSDVRTALPHITVNRPMLAWERHIDGTQQEVKDPPIPWMAVLVFTAGEIIDDPDAIGAVTGRSVRDFLLGAESGVTVPKLDITDDNEYAGACRTIDVREEVMRTIAPTVEDLPLLAHMRHVRHPGIRTQSGEVFTEGDFTVIVGNRFPRMPGPYVAHLVSFEGLLGQLQGRFPGNGTVRLCTLAHWAFTCEESGIDAAALLLHLVAPGSDTHGDGLALRSPRSVDGTDRHAVHARARLERGYVPVPFVTTSGEETFAWYRGPFIPYTAHPLPSTIHADPHSSSDHALIFDNNEYGMFDISYACAWTLGRTMALMAPDTRQAIARTRRRLRNAAAYLLTAANENRAWSGTSFSALPALERLGRAASTGRIRAAFHAPDPDVTSRPFVDLAQASKPASPPPSPAESLGTAAAQARLQSEVEPFAPEIASWLDQLAYLYGVPFNMLVPDPDALPEESLRFFAVDPDWVKSFVDGAKDTAVATGTDALTHPTFAAMLAASMTSQPGAGMLLRSALVPAWPDVVIVATDARGAIPELRRALLAPNVLLVLFERIPNHVDIVENSEGIHHGTLMDGSIQRRNPSTGAGTGIRFPTTGTIFDRYLRAPASGQAAVLKVGGSDGIAKGLSDAAPSQGKAKDVALQLIVSSLRQRITVPATTGG